MKEKGQMSKEERGFKTTYGSREPSSKEESSHVSDMARIVGQKPDSIGPIGGHTHSKTHQPK